MPTQYTFGEVLLGVLANEEKMRLAREEMAAQAKARAEDVKFREDQAVKAEDQRQIENTRAAEAYIKEENRYQEAKRRQEDIDALTAKSQGIADQVNLAKLEELRQAEEKVDPFMSLSPNDALIKSRTIEKGMFSVREKDVPMFIESLRSGRLYSQEDPYRQAGMERFEKMDAAAKELEGFTRTAETRIANLGPLITTREMRKDEGGSLGQEIQATFGTALPEFFDMPTVTEYATSDKVSQYLDIVGTLGGKLRAARDSGMEATYAGNSLTQFQAYMLHLDNYFANEDNQIKHPHHYNAYNYIKNTYGEISSNWVNTALKQKKEEELMKAEVKYQYWEQQQKYKKENEG